MDVAIPANEPERFEALEKWIEAHDEMLEATKTASSEAKT